MGHDPAGLQFVLHVSLHVLPFSPRAGVGRVSMLLLSSRPFGTLASPFLPRYNGTRPSRWLGEADPWLHGYWSFDWADNYVSVASITPRNSTIAISPATPALYGLVQDARYYALNLFSELDQVRSGAVGCDQGGDDMLCTRFSSEEATCNAERERRERKHTGRELTSAYRETRQLVSPRPIVPPPSTWPQRRRLRLLHQSR